MLVIIFYTYKLATNCKNYNFCLSFLLLLKIKLILEKQKLKELK